MRKTKSPQNIKNMTLKKRSDVDSGYAWVILVSGFTVTIMSAVSYINGVFVFPFLDEFETSRGLISWCFALQLGLSNVSGLLGSVVADRFGVRLTAILGGIFLFLGVFLTAVATSLLQVFLCYGVLAGLGVGFTYTPASVILGFYFDKYRNAAYGVLTTGVGVGLMVLGPLANYLMDQFGWRGALLLISAILAHTIVCGALMRPPVLEGDDEKTDKEYKDTGVIVKNDHVKDRLNCMENGRKATSVRNIYLGKQQVDKSRTASLRSGLNLTNSFRDLLNAPICHLSAQCIHSAATDDLEQMLKNDHKIPESLHESEPCIIKTSNRTSLHIKETEETNTSSPSGRKWFLNPLFLALLFNYFAIGLGSSCIYIHFPAYSIQLGTSAQGASFLVSVMGVGNIVGRLGMGVVTNVWKSHTMSLYIATNLITGIGALFGPLICRVFTGQVVFSIVFMSLANSYIVVMAPLTIVAVGLSNLNIAFGCSICLCGCGFLVGPTLAGWLFDITTSYFYTFILSGACFLVGALIIPVSTLLNKGHSSSS